METKVYPKVAKPKHGECAARRKLDVLGCEVGNQAFDLLDVFGVLDIVRLISRSQLRFEGSVGCLVISTFEYYCKSSRRRHLAA